MARSIIPSLAMLKVNWDVGRDYIENFVPFVAECIRASPHPEVSLPDLQRAMAKTFGFDIPQGALQTILRRAAKHQYVVPSEGIYRRNDEALAGLDLSRSRSDVLRKYEALLERLTAYCKGRFQIEWSSDEADAAFLAFLEEDSSAILASAVLSQEVPRPAGNVRAAHFLVASFVGELDRSDPEGFEFLETIVKGSMLAGVLLFSDLGQVERHFERVEVYFDTPFVLLVLGLEGESRQAPPLELVRLLYEQNANLAIFDHTLDEVRRVLSAAAYAVRNYENMRRSVSPVTQYMIDSNYSASDVELIIARLERSLRALHIRVKDKPPHSESLGVNEVRLESILQEEVGYAREQTLFHDLDSVTAIYRLRRGEVQLHIESCRAIFITSNHAVARASTRFLTEEYEDYTGSVVPICLLDHLFTTIVWLKKPLAAPNFPRKRLIADCYAAMNPPDRLWRMYLEEIDRLRTRGDLSKEDYDLLRLSAPARGALMDLTWGDSEVFTEGTVREVLERAQAAARAETEKALHAEEEALRAEKEKGREAEREARIRLKQAREETEAVAREYEAQRQAQLDHIRTLSTRIGRWVATSVGAIGLVLLAVSTFLGLFLPDLPGGWWMPLVAGIFVFFGIAVLANLILGATLVTASRRLEVAVSAAIERTMKRLVRVL